MITSRKATRGDIPAIVDLAVESVSRDPLPVRIDREAMRDMVVELLSANDFVWVSEADGVVVAAVAACSQKSFWYKGRQVSVLLYYSRHPRAGIPLLRELASWCKSRAGVKVAVIEFEPGVDPRLVKYLRRLGFTRESLNLSYVRGTTDVQGS